MALKTFAFLTTIALISQVGLSNPLKKVARFAHNHPYGASSVGCGVAGFSLGFHDGFSSVVSDSGGKVEAPDNVAGAVVAGMQNAALSLAEVSLGIILGSFLGGVYGTIGAVGCPIVLKAGKLAHSGFEKLRKD